ncbi:MAG: hypothetical protein J6N32_06990, partial [Clostridia bacterium]|nr:hypothetical protein [Clostridia bacterium]
METFESLSENEIKELITNRLISNLLCHEFSFESYDDITNAIVLNHDPCGSAIITTMRAIEEGKVICQRCEGEKTRKFHNFIADMSEGGIQIIKQNKKFYMSCKKCGYTEEITNDIISNPHTELFCCPNIECTFNEYIDFWKNHFDYEILDSGNYTASSFSDNLLNRFDNNEGKNKLICRECNNFFIIKNSDIVKYLTQGYNTCPFCMYSSELDHANVLLEKYDTSIDEVTLLCQNCNTRFYLTIDQFESEYFECPVCFFDEIERAKIDINTPISKLP